MKTENIKYKDSASRAQKCACTNSAEALPILERKFKNSGIPWIGMIPSDWNVVRTKNVFACSKSLVGEDWSHTQLLSLTTKGVKEVAIGSTSGKVPDSYETYQVVNKDDLVMCLFDLDCSAVFSGVSNFHGMISPAYKVLKTLDGYSPAFYGYWFDYIFDGRKYKYLSKNIRYSLTYDEFAALGIAAPPLPTQQRIADFLDRKCAEIDELAALQETMIAELKRYKQSVITEAVTKGLDKNVKLKDSGEEWIGEIPSHWEMKAVKYVLQRRNQKNDPIISEERLSLSIGVGITKYADKTTNLDRFKDDFTQYQLAYPDDIVLNSMNMIVGAVGKSAFMGCVSPVYYVMIPKNSIESTYYSYLLNTPRIRDVYHSLGKGIYAIERGDGRVNTCRLKVSFYDFGRIEIPVPPNQEQQQINVFLQRKCAEIDELIAIKQQKIEALKEYKKSVIFEYVTGKKEVAI